MEDGVVGGTEAKGLVVFLLSFREADLLKIGDPLVEVYCYSLKKYRMLVDIVFQVIPLMN